MSEIQEALKSLIQPWHEALKNPKRAQEEALQRLLTIYARTEYGAQHRAGKIGSIEEYRRAFPIMTYPDYKPIIEQVMRGHYQALLTEPPLGWAMTRGTTGQPKYIPMIELDMQYRGLCGARSAIPSSSSPHLSPLYPKIVALSRPCKHPALSGQLSASG